MHIKKIILCMSGTIFSFNTYANTYENQLEQITITANKNNESFINSTHAVAVTNDTKITKQQPTNIYQVLNTMSGVHVDATNPFFAIPQIRGLSRGHTIINVDGFSKSYNSNKGNALSPISIDPYLIKQIDLTKGSSSGVYGSGGLGGVISISTKNATDLLNPNSNIGGFIRSQYYSIDNTHRESIGFYGQNNNKTFDWLISASDYNRDASTNNITNTINTQNYMLKTGYYLNDEQHLELKLTHVNDQFVNTKVVNPDDAERCIYQIKYDIDNGDFLDLKTNISYEEIKRNSKMLRAGNQEVNITNFAADIQNSNLILSNNFKHHFMYGAHIAKISQNGQVDGKTESFVAPKGDRKELTGFIQDKISWDKLSLIPTLRYVNYSLESDTSKVTIDTTKYLSNWGLLYQANSWLNINANYGNDFRAPSIDELYTTKTFPNGMKIIANPHLKPEEGLTKEIGFTLHNSNIFQAQDYGFIKFNYFKQDIKNLIDIKKIASLPFPVYGSVNIKKVKRSGYEIDMQYLSNLANFSFSSDFLTTHDLSSHTISHQQRLFKLGVDKELRSNLSLSWAGVIANRDHDDNSGGYFIHNLHSNWKNAFNYPGLEIDLGIDNLFDKKYETIFNYQGQERTFLIGLGYKF